MCDTMMLAFWVWSLVFWTEGLAKNSLEAMRVRVSDCGMRADKIFRIRLGIAGAGLFGGEAQDRFLAGIHSFSGDRPGVLRVVDP